MLKKTIKFVDFDGNEREESHYFNLTKAELTEMEMSTNGGLTKMIEKIVETRDGSRIIAIFKELILKSYGEKSLDGRRFIKSKELSEEFSQTGAYDALFMELATDADKASDFIKGIIPADIDMSQAQIPENLKVVK
jgi:hypothetical protein